MGLILIIILTLLLIERVSQQNYLQFYSKLKDFLSVNFLKVGKMVPTKF